MTQLITLFSAALIVAFLFSAAAAQQCLNGGTPVGLTGCQCPAYIGGSQCETVKCQRWGIPDKDRCACAPGWYDKYCGIRGCRPPNEDNLDHSKRSVILVVNAKTSMAAQLKALRDNFKNMVSKIQKDWNNGNGTVNWIENYIVYGFVQATGKTTITQMTSDSADDVVDFLGKMQLIEGDSSQPVLTAVKNAQQTFPSMKSHAILLVFTDSPASDATPWSHRFEDRNTEQLCLQISFLWRSKVSFILSLPSDSDVSSDSVDVYKRLSMSTHGDYFYVKDQVETVDILNNVVSTYFFPENVGVGFGVNDAVFLETTPDSYSDYVFTLITKDLNSEYGFPDVPGTISVAQGASYKLVVGQYLSSLYIPASEEPFNYRTFLQSKNTLLFDYNSDMMIDVGNGIVHLGVTMHSTIRTFGFPDYKNMTYHVIQSNGRSVRDDFVAFKRTQTDCTFEVAFPPWNNTNDCPPGPITQVHVLNYDGYYKARVTPGYCDQIAHYSPQVQGFVVPQVEEEVVRDDVVPVESCSDTNIAAINDPRLDGANQFIFILEQNSANQKVYDTLVKEIGQIVALANSVSSASYKKEFTLIVNNDMTSRVLLSTYNPDTFTRKFKSLVTGLLYTTTTNPFGLWSVVQAQKMNIKPTAQVYYFTNQATKSVRNDTKGWDIVNRDIEFNFFTIADGVTTEVFALPWQLELVQKMSNGRIIPLGAVETTLVNVFADMMPMNALTTDNEKYDCHTAPYTLDAFVEKETQGTVFQFVGTALSGISIKDAAGKDVSVASSTSFSNPNFQSLNIDASKYSAGVWKVSVSTARGGCQITVRHSSTNGVIYGFTANSTTDTVDSQIPLQRTTATPRELIYVPIRIRQSQTAAKASTSSLEIQLVNRKRYDQPVSYLNMTVLERDSSTCSFNHMTTKVRVPQNELTTWTLTSYDTVGNLILHRIFYYYQHYPADTSICHGGEVDMYGQCVCPQRYTGEYCWDRICAPGATLSYGICSCASGFYGDFCELEILMPNATTLPTTPRTNRLTTVPNGESTSTTFPSTTTSFSSPHLPGFPSILLVFATLFFL